MSWQGSGGEGGRGPGTGKEARLAVRRRERKIMSKINGGLQTHARRRRGLRPRARMVLDLMAAEGRAGQEKGHRWAEALSSVKVLKVNWVSVKLTLCSPPPSSQTRWLRNRVFMAPTALSLMKDVRAVIPTCCGGRVVYLIEHIGCILYIVTSQSVPAMRSAYRVPFGSCPSMTVVFDVWYAVRLRSEPPDSG